MEAHPPSMAHLVLLSMILILATSLQAGELSLLSFGGGGVNAVATRDHHAFLGEGASLTVVDLTTSDTEIVSRKLLPGVVVDIALQDTLAYIAGNSGEMWVLDISDPTSPVLEKSFAIPQSTDSIKVDDHVLYLTDGSTQVRLYDISSPTSPSLAASFFSVRTVTDVHADGGLLLVAYAANWPYSKGGFQIVDVSVPTSPTLRYQYTNFDYATAVYLSESTAYLRGDKLWVVDVSVPTTPVIQGSVSAPSANVIAKSGTTLFLGYGWQDLAESGASGWRLSVVDVSNPSSPKARYVTGAWGTKVDLAVGDNSLVIATGDSGYTIMDITDPQAPIVLKSYPTLGRPYRVDVSGGLAAFLVNGRKVQLLDIKDPTRPAPVATYPPVPGPFSDSATPAAPPFPSPSVYAYTDLDFQPSKIHVATWSSSGFGYDQKFSSGLRVIDVPSSLALGLTARSYSGLTTDSFQGLKVVGNLAYISSEEYLTGLPLSSRFHVIDISDPAHFTVLNPRFFTGGYAYGIDVQFPLACVATGARGLKIVDVADPRLPVLRGSFDTAGDARDVSLVGSLSVVADGSSGLQIVDTSYPTSPTLLSTLDTPGFAQRVDTYGPLAFVADGVGGVHAVDLTNPSEPVLRDSFNTPGEAKDIAVSGRMIYVADGDAGFLILRYDGPLETASYGWVFE